MAVIQIPLLKKSYPLYGIASRKPLRDLSQGRVYMKVREVLKENLGENVEVLSRASWAAEEGRWEGEIIYRGVRFLWIVR